MATQSAAADSSNNRSKTILIVDDLPANRALLTATLSLAGYFVFEATSGAECLHLLERLRPCLILLDVMMPEIDGFETCSRIRQDPELRQIPIAFLTS
jgi:CheY-like chemotaxis protein